MLLASCNISFIKKTFMHDQASGFLATPAAFWPNNNRGQSLSFSFLQMIRSTDTKISCLDARVGFGDKNFIHFLNSAEKL